MGGITTKTGDGGTTALCDGVRIPKDDPRVAALGAADELNAHLGVVKSLCADGEINRGLERLQQTLMRLMALIAYDGVPAQEAFADFTDDTRRLEDAIGAWDTELPKLSAFILYGGPLLSAQLQLARAVARRAEACLVTAARGNPVYDGALAYINRLSDYLFTLARFIPN